MSRFGFPSAWFVVTLALAKPLYWGMVEAPWGLVARGQLTVENHFAVFALIALITASLAALLTGKLTASTQPTARRR